MVKKFEGTKKRKFDDPWRYLYAILIALFLMIFGFLASYSMSAFEYKRVSELQESVFYEFYKKQLIYDMFIDLNKCDLEYYEDISTTLDFQGAMLNQLEQDLSSKKEEIIEKKENYYLLQLSHYNLMKKLNEECSFNNDFILFFYSNDKNNIDNSERVGRILSSLKAKDNSVMIYSFDADSDSDLMNLVKSRYDVDEPLVLIVNEDTKLTGVRTIDDILEVL